MSHLQAGKREKSLAKNLQKHSTIRKQGETEQAKELTGNLEKNSQEENVSFEDPRGIYFINTRENFIYFHLFNR